MHKFWLSETAIKRAYTADTHPSTSFRSTERSIVHNDDNIHCFMQRRPAAPPQLKAQFTINIRSVKLLFE